MAKGNLIFLLVMIPSVTLVVMGVVAVDQNLRIEVEMQHVAPHINFTSNMTDKEKMAIIDEKCELYMRGSQSCKYDLYERLITGGGATP